MVVAANRVDGLRCHCLEKRSLALLGSNQTRDIQADGAPQGASGPRLKNTGDRLFSIPLDTGAMPPKSENGILINGNELRKSTLNSEEPKKLLTRSKPDPDCSTQNFD